MILFCKNIIPSASDLTDRFCCIPANIFVIKKFEKSFD